MPKYIETQIAGQKIRVWKENRRLKIKSPRKWSMDIAIADLKPSLFIDKIGDPQARWALFHFIRANITDICPKCKEQVPLEELDGDRCVYCRPCVMCEKVNTEKTYEKWGSYNSSAGYICGKCADDLLTIEERKQKAREVLV